MVWDFGDTKVLEGCRMWRFVLSCEDLKIWRIGRFRRFRRCSNKCWQTDGQTDKSSQLMSSLDNVDSRLVVSSTQHSNSIHIKGWLKCLKLYVQCMIVWAIKWKAYFYRLLHDDAMAMNVVLRNIVQGRLESFANAPSFLFLHSFVTIAWYILAILAILAYPTMLFLQPRTISISK